MLNNAQMFTGWNKDNFRHLVSLGVINVELVMAFQNFHHFLAYLWRYFNAPLGQVSITLTTVATST